MKMSQIGHIKQTYGVCPASMRASRPRRGRARRRRRVADASPLPWSRTSAWCLFLASKSHVFSVGRISLCLSVPSER
jgi:hypothetical protein